METIFALASAKGRAGVSIVRLSGAHAHGVVRGLTRMALPPCRQAALRHLYWKGEVLDQALVLLFQAGQSFTGEDIAELHLHGSQAVVSAVLRALGDHQGLRVAEPGEFTRRALENGCLDLTQVEGLSDLIAAETEAQRRHSLQVLSGAIGKRVALWRDHALRAAALVEATIDFADEEVPVDVSPEVRSLIQGLKVALVAELAGAKAAERIRDGFEVAIVGLPNAGKSTLLNALAGREAAITSAVAGTTRDVIEVRMDLGGLAVTLLDTAGLRETVDEVEAIGIARAIERARMADLRIFLQAEPGEVLLIDPLPEDILLLGKADQRRDGRGVSGKTGQGLDDLVAQVTAVLSSRVTGAGLLNRERQRIAVSRAVDALESAERGLVQLRDTPELVALELRRALDALEILMGRVGVEDLLGEIFSRFCIGK